MEDSEPEENFCDTDIDENVIFDYFQGICCFENITIFKIIFAYLMNTNFIIIMCRV